MKRKPIYAVKGHNWVDTPYQVSAWVTYIKDTHPEDKFSTMLDKGLVPWFELIILCLTNTSRLIMKHDPSTGNRRTRAMIFL